MNPLSALDSIDHRITALAANLKCGCWIRFADGRPNFWSREVFEIFGFETDAHPPPIDAMMHRIDRSHRSRLLNSADRCERHRARFSADYSLTHPNGRRIHVKSRGQIIPGMEGSVIAGTLLDVTELQSVHSDLATLAGMQKKNAFTAPSERLTPGQWRRTEDLLHARSNAGLTVAEMAAHAHLSPSLFSRRFRATTGQTPLQYVLSLRLERARAALASTGASIARVATDFGFFDQAHFSRHFKRRYGLTPGVFMRQETSSIAPTDSSFSDV
ncbi:hypothetical protein DB347_00080 [Opitutaceae bacterium EW11]|nr:hypothetical protein DB347_00080 [Opitutaceae bacterium EW11]